MSHFFFISKFLVSEYIGGGELFDTIRKFPYKLIQLYVAEIAVALGKPSIPFTESKMNTNAFRMVL